MGLVSNFISNISAKTSFGVFSSLLCGEGVGFDGVLRAFGNLIRYLFQSLLNLFYAVCKWMLYIVDVIFTYTSSPIKMESGTSAAQKYDHDSDIVFNLLSENEDLVSKIVRALIILALIMILVLSIIAIVKNQFDAVKSGKPSSVVETIKTMMKSFLFLIITPLIVVLGIIASDFILTRSLTEILNVSNSSSLSTNVFSMASTPGNIYRTYAENGVRIPITFDFSKEEKIYKAYQQDGVDSEYKEYLNDPNRNAVYATYRMFTNGTYDTFADLKTVNKLNAYNTIYDFDENNRESSLLENGDPNPLYEYKRIRAYQEEYYVMADLVDYAVASSNQFYIKTIEEIMDSIVEITDETQAERILTYFMNVYGIELYNGYALVADYQTEKVFEIEGTDPIEYGVKTAYDIYKAKQEWNVIRFTTNYYSYDDNGVARQRQIQYNHVKGSVDEANGAVFIVSYETSRIIGSNTEINYFEPATVGYKGFSGASFESAHIYRNQMVAAKGVFDIDQKPTAIRKSKNNDIVFYRDNLANIVEGKTGDILKIDTTENTESNLWEGIKSFFKKIVNPFNMIPEIEYSPEKIALTYNKETVSEGRLAGSELHIGYMFTTVVEYSINGSTYGLSLHNMYDSVRFNWIILMLLSAMLLLVSLSIVFRLIKCVYDLFLVILIYPTACATMPIDSGEGYKKWTQRYLSRLFSIAALRLSITFVLMLFPIIESIEFFTVDEVANSKTAQRIGSTLIGIKHSAIDLFNDITGTNIQQNSVLSDTNAVMFAVIGPITKALNMLVAVFFELVALAMLRSGKNNNDSIAQTINEIILGEKSDNLDEDDPRHEIGAKLAFAGHMTRRGVGRTLGTVRKVYRVATRKEGLIDGKKLLPGSALFEAAGKKKELKDKFNKERILNSLEDKNKKSPAPPKDGAKAQSAPKEGGSQSSSTPKASTQTSTEAPKGGNQTT